MQQIKRQAQSSSAPAEREGTVSEFLAVPSAQKPGEPVAARPGGELWEG